MRQHFALALAAALLLVACRGKHGKSSASEPTVSTPTTASAPASTDAVLMERGPCYGTCPVYSVRLSANGAVHFEGKAHVMQLGAATATIPRQAVDSLFRYIEGVGFNRLEESYTEGSRNCGPYVTDLATITVTLTGPRSSKHVTLDYGCGAAPRTLRDVHRRIDSVAGTQRWIGSR